IFGEDICNQIPGCVGEFIPLCHLGLLALMAVYFTENRISWVYVQSLSEKTVSTYKTRLLQKLNIKSVVYLAEFAKRNNLIE
ncbi:hypothetical protein TU85_25375, partial [Pseudomonas helleri]|uniref:LuxR C-terminal-related transcriptional regulator n=3 Tax=Pseudomonas helleri TaxID=1608996 RepID=UPI0006537C9C